MATNLGSEHNLGVQSSVEVLFPVIATVGVIIRLGLRHRYKISLLWDDALIVLSVLFTWGLWGVWYWTTIHVIGSREMAMRTTTPPLLQKLCMTMDLFYGEGINIVKFAILFFYLRAFASSPNARKTRYAIWTMMGFVSLFSVSRAVETAYLCPPICFGLPREYSVAGWQFAMRAINWLTEFIILLFPIPILWKLMIPTKKKVAISICFLLGVITCAASAGRMESSVRLYLMQNAIAKKAADVGGIDQAEWFYTYYIPQMSHMTLWSLAELNVGIITATLPAIRSPAVSLTKDAVRKIRASRTLNTKTNTNQRTSPIDPIASITTTSSTRRSLDEKEPSPAVEEIV